MKSEGREGRGVRSEEERVFNKNCVVGASRYLAPPPQE